MNPLPKQQSKPAKAKPAKRKRRRNAIRKFDVLQPGKTYKDPKTGQQTQLPSLQSFVEEQYAFKTRQSMVELAVRLYGCHPTTVDRCIARAKDNDAEEMHHDRVRRVTNLKMKFLNLARLAVKEKDLKTASDALLNAAKVAGDLRPFIVAQPNMPPGSIAELSEDELLKIVQHKAD